MITESIDYLRESDDVLKTVLIGGVLMAFAWLLIPFFFVLGYVVRVVRRTASGDDEPPVFDEWEDLAVTGAKAFAIQFVYSIVPALLAGVVVGVGVLGVATGTDAGGVLGGLFVVVGTLLALVFGLLAAYLSPAALANFAEKETVGAGFAIGDLRPVWTNPTYARAWLLGAVVVLAAGVLGGVLGLVPVLGQALAAFVTFYALVAAYYIIGHAWGELAGREVGGDEGRPDEHPTV